MEKKRICLEVSDSSGGGNSNNNNNNNNKEEEEEEKVSAETVQDEHGIIDIRHSDEFDEGHIPGSTSIPADVLPQLLCALPPRDIDKPVGLAIAAAADRPEETAEAQRVMESSGYIVTRVVTPDSSFTDKSPSRRIWSPNSSIESVIDRVEALAHKDNMPLTALDIGCGSGRDAVFLATRGWQRVVGMDYQQRLLDCAVLLARHEGCPEGSVVMQNVDVFQLDPATYEERFTLVHFARFLHRPMLAPETGCIPKLVAPGGFLVCHTFMEPCKKPGKPQFLLKKNELLELFRDTFKWEIIEYQETHLKDGRPIQFLCARKPLSRE